ncbi:MAG: orotidine-5'-phosphate decarboxylase [Actinomycetes bacterium]|jgi:orotidine-5'-phosphate decarboxylase
MSTLKSPIILALDTDELETAIQWIEATAGSVDVYKVGLEFFLKHGAAGLRELRNTSNFELFLDLKLHDIPNTVAGAVRSVRDLQPRFLTVHAAGGAAMIKAAAEAGPTISITAVTVLTSLNQAELSTMGIALTPLDFAVSLARNAVASGARSIVCSPMEVAAIRSAVGSGVKIITPGVRPADSELGDQSRTMTPREAIVAGADFLVIGRPITSYHSRSPQAMRERSQQILESLS